jgi:hypothetical protein
VHYWYQPDSYDEWIPTARLDSKEVRPAGGSSATAAAAVAAAAAAPIYSLQCGWLAALLLYLRE